MEGTYATLDEVRESDLVEQGQPSASVPESVEQRSGPVVLVRDETIHRHRAVHNHLAHQGLPCFGGAPKLACREPPLL